MIAIVFAIHNHAEQAVDLWPLPFVIELPLYGLVLIAVAAGEVGGARMVFYLPLMPTTASTPAGDSTEAQPGA